MTNQSELLINWMKKRDSGDWHRVASTYNWDFGVEPLLWIANQPTCEKATALHMFWYSCPDNTLRYESLEQAESSYCGNDFRLTKLIADNWSAGRYTNARIAFGHDSMMLSFENWSEVASQTDNPPFVVPLEMHSPIKGEILSTDGFQEGFPKEIWPQIWPSSFQ